VSIEFIKEGPRPSDDGIGYESIQKFRRGVSLPPHPQQECRNVFIIGDKLAGKTTFCVAPLDEDFSNQSRFAEKIGLFRGIFTNRMYAERDVSTDARRYLDTDYGYGDYSFIFHDFASALNLPIPDPEPDWLKLDVVEFGGGLLQKMMLFDPNDPATIGNVSNVPLQKAKELVVSSALNKLEHFTDKDTILYFVNLRDLYAQNNTEELKQLFADIISRVSFLRGKNANVKIRYILNQIDEMGGGKLSDCINKLVTAITSDDSFDIGATFYAIDPQYANLIHDALANVFVAELGKEGVLASPDDFEVTHILEKDDEMNEADMLRVFQSVYEAAHLRYDISNIIVKHAFEILDAQTSIKAQDVRDAIMKAYPQYVPIANTLAGQVDAEFIGIMENLSEKGLVVRDCVDNKSPDCSSIIVIGFELYLINFYFCEKDISPFVPARFVRNEIPSITDFMKLVANGTIPVTVLEDEFCQIQLPQALYQQIEQDADSTLTTHQSLFHQIALEDTDIEDKLVQLIRDPLKDMNKFRDFTTQDTPESVIDVCDDPFARILAIRDICLNSDRLEPLLITPVFTVASLLDQFDKMMQDIIDTALKDKIKQDLVEKIKNSIWINPEFASIIQKKHWSSKDRKYLQEIGNIFQKIKKGYEN
jgi:hypothetical protein